VIVVDNGSRDGSPEAVRVEFPAVRLIETGKNLGFAGGNNVGLRAATGEYRLLLNSDTEVTPGALDRLAKCLDRNPKAGACGPQLLYPDGRPQPSGSSFITLSNLLWEQLFLDKLFPASPIFAEHFLSEWHYRQRRKLDVISGACLMMRTACLEQIGLLDANYFMYCEDVDWCLRAERAGWDRIFVPEVRVLHHHGASSRAFRPAMVRIYNESRCYYFRKFGGREAALEAKRIMVAGARLRQTAWSALSLVRKGAAVQARDWKEIAERTAALDPDTLPEPGNMPGD
jgi:GT2 family glycosyltransferase